MFSSTTTGATSWAELFRVSLRELLLLVAMVALAIASMKYASTAWRTCVYTITMAIFMWATVIAVIDRGLRQATAIGMVLVMAIYAVIVLNGRTTPEEGNRELDSRRGRLPTTRVTNYLFAPARVTYWFDAEARKTLPDYDPANPTPGVKALQFSKIVPNPATLMAIAHCWWALLLGYIGGRFARVVYLRRSDLPRTPDAAYQHN